MLRQMSKALSVLALCAYCACAGVSVGQELSIRRTVTVEVESERGILYELQSSSNLIKWLTLEVFKGTGEMRARTETAEGAEFYRLSKEVYPTLSKFEVVSGGKSLTPAFSPGVFHYYF